MDLITLARQMGKELQKSQEYQNITIAKSNNDADKNLQTLIEEFNMCRVSLSTEMQKETKDEEKMAEYDAQLKDIYTKVMANENMVYFNSAKQEMDKMMNDVNTILSMCANGEDPDTCELPSNCSGSCSSCSGCH
ncbi:MAG: YlbF family regulator [Oscillospiraceae bacterium]